jgi:hypothetical protein
MSVEPLVNSARLQVKGNLSVPPTMAKPTITSSPIIFSPTQLPSEYQIHLMFLPFKPDQFSTQNRP